MPYQIYYNKYIGLITTITTGNLEAKKCAQNGSKKKTVHDGAKFKNKTWETWYFYPAKRKEQISCTPSILCLRFSNESRTS
jgi:hypothetical protein